MYSEEAKKYNSTMTTGFTLLSIDPEKGTPSTSLGPKMGMEATSLSRTLKLMEEKGLIERKKNPDDGRSVLVHLTEYGLEMRDFSKEVVIKFDEAVKKTIPVKKLETFLEVMHEINDLVGNKKIYK